MLSHLARRVVRAVATSCATANGSSQRGFYFVSASYQGRSLLSAATELALSVREAMGPDRPPHLITLFATPHGEWGAGLADTPQYIRQLLTYEDAKPPVVVGGVLRSVGGGGSPSLATDGSPCVALMAAHLPGVRLMPFHTTQSSLPALPGDGWSVVVRLTRALASARAAAAAATVDDAAAVAAVGVEETANRKLGSEPSERGPAAAAAAAVACVSRQSQLGARVEEEVAAGAGGVAVAAARAAAAGCGGASLVERAPGAAAEDAHGGGRHGKQLLHQRQQQQQRTEQVQSPPSAAGSSGADGGPAAASSTMVGNRESVGAPSPPSSPSSSSSSPMCSVATLLFSTPHFVEVEELLRRFGQVAPGMQVVGGVTSPGAWGDSESNWGAVWLNDRTYAQGAVGCVLQGPFKLDTLVSPGFRGVGPVMRATQAQGQHVLELDGEPVQRPLQRAISEALNSGELATSLKIGLGDAAANTVASNSGSSNNGHSSSSSSGDSSRPQPRATAAAAAAAAQHARLRTRAVLPPQPIHQGPQASGAGAAAGSRPPPPPRQLQQQQQPVQGQFVTRNWFFQQGPPRPFMTVQSFAPVANGTPIQVHVQNYPAAHRHMRDRLLEYAEQLPAELVTAEGAVGALALSCSALPFFEGPDVASCLPRAALAGGKVEGEFCSTVEGQPSRLHSFASCVAPLRAASP